MAPIVPLVGGQPLTLTSGALGARRFGRKGVDEGRVGRLAAVAEVQGPPLLQIEDDVESLPLPDGDYGLPYIGQTFSCLKNPRAFALERHRRYGNISKSMVFGERAISVAGIENIEKLLRRENELLETRTIPSVRALTGPHALYSIDGEEHAFVRKLVRPAFTQSAVESYVHGITQRTEKLCEEWSKEDSILFVEQAKRFAFAVVAEGVVGIKFHKKTLDELLDVFQTCWDGMISHGIDLPFTKFGKAMAARRELITIIEDEIENLKLPENKGKKTMLATMLEAEDEDGQKLSKEQIVDQVFNTLLSTYHTTTSMLSTLFLELGKSPKIWERIKEEQKKIVSLFGQEITAASLQAMDYATAVVKEALRIFPVFTRPMRHARKTFGFNGYKIPKGWAVYLEYGITGQYLDQRFPNPEVFAPERFLAENGRKQEVFGAFGGGIHTCMGKNIAMFQAKALLAVLARSYKFLVENTAPEMNYLPVREPKDGLPMKVERVGALA